MRHEAQMRFVQFAESIPYTFVEPLFGAQVVRKY